MTLKNPKATSMDPTTRAALQQQLYQATLADLQQQLGRCCEHLRRHGIDPLTVTTNRAYDVCCPELYPAAAVAPRLEPVR